MSHSAQKVPQTTQPAPTHFRAGAGFCYRQFRPLKGRWCKNGVNQMVVIRKVIAALREFHLCSYTAVADKQDFYHSSPLLILKNIIAHMPQNINLQVPVQRAVSLSQALIDGLPNLT